MQTKKHIRILLLLFSLVAITSCQKDDKTEDSINTKFIGTWEHLEYPLENTVYMIRLQFEEDGTYMADSWEIWYGTEVRQESEGYGLSKAQATELICSKSFDYQSVVVGGWSTNGNYLTLNGFWLDNNVLSYAFIGGKLIIPQDEEENLVFTKK